METTHLYTYNDIVTLLLVALYLLPLIVAGVRKHPSRSSIAVVNIFLGWTLLGWVVSLAWAVGPMPVSSSLPAGGRPGSFT